MMTSVKSYTAGTEYQYLNRWMYVSDITLDNLDNTFSVPTTNSVAGASDLGPAGPEVRVTSFCTNSTRSRICTKTDN